MATPKGNTSAPRKDRFTSKAGQFTVIKPAPKANKSTSTSKKK